MMQYFDFSIYYYQTIMIPITGFNIQDFAELTMIFLSIRYHLHFIFLPKCFHSFLRCVDDLIFIGQQKIFKVIKTFHSKAIEIFRSNQMFNRIIVNQLISLVLIDYYFLINLTNCFSTTLILFS